MPSPSQHLANSNVERLATDEGAVYVKQAVPGGWLQTWESVQEQSANEAAVARRAAQLSQFSARFGAVNVVDSDPSSARIVTEEIPGTTLQQLALTAGRPARNMGCTRALLVAGRWLHAFQSLSLDGYQVRTSAADPRGLLDYCDLRLRTLKQLGHHWPTPRMRDTVLAWLGQRLQETPTSLQREVWCHCDFGPFNLIWDGRTITPIDFATARPGLPLLDVTYLVHRLEMWKLQFPWRALPLGRWRRAVLRGYGLPRAGNLPIYRALMVRHLLCRLQTLFRLPPKSQRERIHNIWLRHRIRAKLSKMVSRP